MCLSLWVYLAVDIAQVNFCDDLTHKTLDVGRDGGKGRGIVEFDGVGHRRRQVQVLVVVICDVICDVTVPSCGVRHKELWSSSILQLYIYSSK
jgi:hypothetical protein